MCHLVIDGITRQIAYHSDGQLPAHLRSEASVAAQAVAVSIPFASGEREPIRVPEDGGDNYLRSYGRRGRSSPHSAMQRRREIRRFLHRVAV